MTFVWLSDKQQELDVPTLKVEDTEAQSTQPRRKEKAQPMSQITGLRKLKHTNSFTGTVLPTYGVEPTNSEELTTVSIKCVKYFEN